MNATETNEDKSTEQAEDQAQSKISIEDASHTPVNILYSKIWQLAIDSGFYVKCGSRTIHHESDLSGRATLTIEVDLG